MMFVCVEYAAGSLEILRTPQARAPHKEGSKWILGAKRRQAKHVRRRRRGFSGRRRHPHGRGLWHRRDPRSDLRASQSRVAESQKGDQPDWNVERFRICLTWQSHWSSNQKARLNLSRLHSRNAPNRTPLDLRPSPRTTRLFPFILSHTLITNMGNVASQHYDGTREFPDELQCSTQPFSREKYLP